VELARRANEFSFSCARPFAPERFRAFFPLVLALQDVDAACLMNSTLRFQSSVSWGACEWFHGGAYWMNPNLLLFGTRSNSLMWPLYLHPGFGQAESPSGLQRHP